MVTAAIIGGGASGAITVDTLRKQGISTTLFERRNILGGVWVYDSQPGTLTVVPGRTEEQSDTASQTPDFDGIEPGEPIHTSPGEYSRQTFENPHRYEPTPTFESLSTNVPERVMTYSDKPKWNWKDSQKVEYSPENRFVHHSTIQRYIEEYFEPNIDLVRFSTTVEKAAKTSDGKWTLTTRTRSPTEDVWTQTKYDHLVVATGHYHVPFIPDVPGIQLAYRLYPDRIVHSKHFRESDLALYRDKSVLVVGSRASGADLVALLAPYATQTIQSVRATGKTPVFKKNFVNQEKVVQTGPVVSYVCKNGGFHVETADGQLFSPDYVFYCTGYQYSYPFLREQIPDLTNGVILPDLFLHTFYTPDPTLAFVGVPVDAVSFRAFEYQAVWVARHISGQVELPTVENQLLWARNRLSERGSTRSYHSLSSLEAVEDFFDTVTALGGGVKSQKKGGRDFPVFSRADIDELKAAAPARWVEKKVEEELSEVSELDTGDSEGQTDDTSVDGDEK
ncbi:Thiol-specific monooxygenase [Yarrowia sp. C11]|nr:Thiol-specific monooxygenase [Yarrowia sp. E02]KAG5367520.1 Thiol-specific monooxygenase [Yarrowia sp. C11]